MKWLRIGTLVLLTTLVVLGAAGAARAQGYYSTWGHPYCGPYGLSYGHPIYPYGAYAGYASPVAGAYHPYSTAPYSTRPWPAVAPRYRDDAYSPWDLYNYGLTAHPSQYAPSVVPSKKVNPTPPTLPAPNPLNGQ
jgi:hypothetical protein